MINNTHTISGVKISKFSIYSNVDPNVRMNLLTPLRIIAYLRMESDWLFKLNLTSLLTQGQKVVCYNSIYR